MILMQQGTDFTEAEKVLFSQLFGGGDYPVVSTEYEVGKSSFVVGNAENNERLLDKLMPLKGGRRKVENKDLLQMMHMQAQLIDEIYV